MPVNYPLTISAYRDIEMVVVQIFKAKPVAKIPRLVLELKRIADTVTDSDKFDDLVQ